MENGIEKQNRGGIRENMNLENMEPLPEKIMLEPEEEKLWAEKKAAEEQLAEKRITEQLNEIMDKWDALDISVCYSIHSVCSSMSYWRDDIHSRSVAERKAKDVFQKVYLVAENYLNPYTRGNFAEQATDSFLRKIKADLITIRDLLRKMGPERLSENETLVREIVGRIDLEKLGESAKNASIEELKDSYYSLSSISNYSEDITYTETEHDPPGLFGKKDYWYDISQAYSALDADMRKYQQMYEKSVAQKLRSEVLGSLINQIDQLTGRTRRKTEDKEENNFSESSVDGFNSALGIVSSALYVLLNNYKKE